MSKLLHGFIVSLLSIAFSLYALPSILPAHADYASAYRGYVFDYQNYRNTYNDFQIAKSTYLTYKTLTAQNDAITKFQTVLKARATLMAGYYNLLQEKLNSTDGVRGDYKNTFSSIKDSEKSWLDGHQKKIEAAASFDDLNSVSDEFAQRYPQMDMETKQAIGAVLSAKESTLKGKVDSEIDAVTSRLNDIRSHGEDTNAADRGVLSARSKLDLYTDKYASAQTVFSGQNQYSNQGINLYDGQAKLSEANQYLREAVNFLLEIVKSFTG